LKESHLKTPIELYLIETLIKLLYLFRKKQQCLVWDAAVSPRHIALICKSQGET